MTQSERSQGDNLGGTANSVKQGNDGDHFAPFACSLPGVNYVLLLLVVLLNVRLNGLVAILLLLSIYVMPFALLGSLCFSAIRVRHDRRFLIPLILDLLGVAGAIGAVALVATHHSARSAAIGPI